MCESVCECVHAGGASYLRPGVVRCMKSPWFILELQCYDPSALAPSPCDKMDKMNSTSVFWGIFTSLTFRQPVFSPSVSLTWMDCMCCFSLHGFSPLSAPSLNLSSCCQRQISETLKNIHRLPLSCLPACLTSSRRHLPPSRLPARCHLYFQPSCLKPQ